MDFGPRAVERSSDERLGGLVHVAEFVLQGLQNGQQRAIQMDQFPDALLRQIGIPRGRSNHAIVSALSTMEQGRRICEKSHMDRRALFI